MKARILAVSSYLPDRTLTNAQLSGIVDTSDEWIVSRTGIRERRVTDIPTWDMATRSSRKALASIGLDPLELDLIIGSTVTADYKFPSMSCIVQHELGAKNAFCFDLNAACSGFIFALDVVNQYIASGRVRRALICSSEALTRVTDYSDRGSCILFGDGSAAALIGADGEKGLMGSYLASDGSGGGALYGAAFQSGTRFTESFAHRFSPPGDGSIVMDGAEVYKFATRAMAECIEKVCAQCGVAVSDLDVIVPHQANIRIIKSVITKYRLDPEKVIINLDKYGNTSSASIPICVAEALEDRRICEGKKVCLVGFGAGLTSGAALLDW